MGQSTNAILCFGLQVDEEHEWAEILCPEDDNYPDLYEYILTKAAISKPARLTDDDGWENYVLAKKAALEAYPIDLVPHCALDFPMWIVAVRRTVQEASRGDAAVVEVTDVTPEEIVALKAFCAEFDIPYTEPAWLLASYVC